MAKRVVETPEEQPPEQGRQVVAVRSGGAAAQDNLRNAGLIIGREYRSRVTQRSFIISTIILLALLAKNTSHAQRIVPVARISQAISIGPGYVVVKPGSAFRQRHHRHIRGTECYQWIRHRKHS